MQMVMGGKFAQQIICRSHAYRSEKEEDFYQVLTSSSMMEGGAYKLSWGTGGGWDYPLL